MGEKSDAKYLIYLGLFLGVVDFFVSSVDLFWFFGCLKKWRRCVLLFPKMKQPPNYGHNYDNFVKYPWMLYFEASIRPLVESFSDLQQRQDFPHSEHLLVSWSFLEILCVSLLSFSVTRYFKDIICFRKNKILYKCKSEKLNEINIILTLKMLLKKHLNFVAFFIQISDR